MDIFALLNSFEASGQITSGLFLIYIVCVIISLIASDRDPSTTIAWILIMILLPGIGVVLYYFTGRNWPAIARENKWYIARQSVRLPFMKNIWGHYEALVEKIPGSKGQEINSEGLTRQIRHIVHTIWRQTDVPPMPARDIEIWASGEEYFPHLIEDLSKAQESIHMSYFIWEEDVLTDKLADVLVERLKAGVEVRILNDFFGCIAYTKKGLDRVKAAGGVVRSDITAINKANYRNHRKITVIDGVLAHTGGVNLGQEYIDGGKAYDSWRDTGMRFRGPAVMELQDLFCQRWFEVHHNSLWTDKYFPIDKIGEGDKWIQIAAQGVEDEWQSSTNAYEVALACAKDYVWIQSPYYVPIDTIHDGLINAAFAGIDVRLMITGVPDKKIAWDAAFTYFETLIKAGVKIYLYEPGFFHAKAIVTDDTASAVGTMNLDVRSLLLHKELMAWMYDKDLALQNKQIFLDDMEHCREVTLEELLEGSNWDRFKKSGFRLMSRLL